MWEFSIKPFGTLFRLLTLVLQLVDVVFDEVGGPYQVLLYINNGVATGSALSRVYGRKKSFRNFLFFICFFFTCSSLFLFFFLSPDISGH